MIDYRNTIKVIGFDLDQTLYPKSPDIDIAIQKYIYVKIADVKKCTLAGAQKQFSDLYQNGKGLSGRKTLIELGIPDAANIIQEALERADIASTLKGDKEINKMLQQLKKRYRALDLVTGADKTDVAKKLRALDISESVFAHCITSDTASKSDGSAYHYWMSLYKDLNPEAFLYIGDRPGTDHDIPHALGIQTVLVYFKEKDTAIKALQLQSLIDITKYLL